MADKIEVTNVNKEVEINEKDQQRVVTQDEYNLAKLGYKQGKTTIRWAPDALRKYEYANYRL